MNKKDRKDTGLKPCPVCEGEKFDMPTYANMLLKGIVPNHEIKKPEKKRIGK